MSSQPAIEEREASNLSKAGISAAYITLILGYLFTILTTTRSTLLNFLVSTVLQVCYSALLWWMIGKAWKRPKRWQLVLAMGLLVLLTEAVGSLRVFGLKWDCRLFKVTLAQCLI